MPTDTIPFFEAAIDLGNKLGAYVVDGAVMRDELEVGIAALAKQLAAGQASATGLARERKFDREPIPPAVWELAVYPEQQQRGSSGERPIRHRIEIIDPTAVDPLDGAGGYCGTLTLCGDTEPSWFSIHVDRSVLTTSKGEPVPARPSLGKHSSKKLESWCKELAQKSPLPSFSDLDQLAKVTFEGISRDAVRKAWKDANPNGFRRGRRPKA